MCIFGKKTVKIASAVGGGAPGNPICLRRLGAPLPDPRVVALAYYYIFVEFISCGKCLLLPKIGTK